MKNPYLQDSDEFKQWEIENEIYEKGQRKLKDMKKYIAEKILFVREVKHKQEVRSVSEIGFCGTIINTTLEEKLEPVYVIDVLLNYKDQDNLTILEIECREFDKWRKQIKRQIK